MKKTTLFTLALFCASVIFGQNQRQQVAVWVEGQEPAKTVIASELVRAISTSPRHTAVERSSDFHRLMTAEIAHQQSGDVDRQVAQLGRQLGVQLILAATVTPFAGTNHISARIINAQTGEINRAATANCAFATIDAVTNTIERLASELLGIPTRADRARDQQLAEQITKDRERGFTITGGLYVQTGASARSVNHAQAIQACRQSRVGGFTDWRLPTVAEGTRIRRRQSEVSNLIEVTIYWTSTEVNPASGHWGSTHSVVWLDIYLNAETIETSFRVQEGGSFRWEAINALCVRGR